MNCKFWGALALLSIACSAFAAQAPDSHAEAGGNLFLQKCAFCHGRDAGGGETGPDLTASDLVKTDVNGNKIGYVVRNGRPEKGMPQFALPDEDIAAVVAFIHRQAQIAATQVGKRRGVDASDLQTGNTEAGKHYFEGTGGCSGCHSPSGDFAHIGARYPQPLQLERHMLYPEKAPATVAVTLTSGEKITGKLAYRDEFTIALRDSANTYHSWPTQSIHFQVDDPAEAHWKLLSVYTDDDIHNLMAYLQSLR